MADSPFNPNESKWIWVPNFDDAAAKGQFVLFRKKFEVSEIPSVDCLLHVSADTRYRLYLNGESISFGPAKSYLSRWYYDTVNITPHLTAGVNVLAAIVLRFSSSHDGCLSMIRSPLPGFILSCHVGDLNLGTGPSWRAKIDAATKLVPDEEWDYRLGPQFLSLNEIVDGRHLQIGWRSGGFDDGDWHEAVFAAPQRKMSPMVDPWRLVPRDIPFLPETPARFDDVVRCSDTASIESWRTLLKGTSDVVVPSNSSQWVEIESRSLTTGFLDTVLAYDGEDSNKSSPTVKILCSECYEYPTEEGKPRVKSDRTDSDKGQLYGLTDTYTLHKGINSYSPFWFSTFRYIRITIDTTNCPSPVTVKSLTYRSTHYPLHVETTIHTSASEIQGLWDISVNTLRNCMHETYEDCPFYEQNQFAMDTRSMILFTYLLSRDDRLPRKAIQEFYASRRDDGLIETHFPCPGRATNIPTFSLFWCLMISDHMEHFGDESLVRKYIGAVDDVLNYFHERVSAETGLVGSFGAESWAFVDWADGWFTPGRGFFGVAVPPVYYRTGSATYHTLVYAYTLSKASELFLFLGRRDAAREYLDRRDALLQAVKKHCFDPETGFFLDGPGANAETEKSQHVQIFAVLSGCVGGDDAKTLLRQTVLERERFGLTKASFALGFYLFRAASRADVYEECWDTLIQPWRKMMADNLTTWAESESMMRSDCHGWSSTPLYEIVTEVLGVQSKSEAYLERVIKAREPDGRNPGGRAKTAVTVAPRTQLVHDRMTASVVGRVSQAQKIGVEILPDKKEVRVTGHGQPATATCVPRDPSWTLQ